MKNVPHSAKDFWACLTAEAKAACASEPFLKDYLFSNILKHTDMAHALAALLASRLGDQAPNLTPLEIENLFAQLFSDNVGVMELIASDLAACCETDPACQSYLQALLNYCGFSAVETYRATHLLWQQGRKLLASHIASMAVRSFHVDIHPAAQIGGGLFIDHAIGVVIGETTIIGKNVTLYQGVTLGGTGKETGARHPILEDDVTVGAGAIILGRVTVGKGARVGAGAVVVKDVKIGTTVAGVPAKPTSAGLTAA